MKMNRIAVIILYLGITLAGCHSDKYSSNRFAGIYEITKYTSELWDSTGKVSSTEIPCKYVFYLTANDNDFGNAKGKFDTSGKEPSFLTALGCSSFLGLERFTFEWNLGTNDNYRLSFLKDNMDGITTSSVILNVKRGIGGKVSALTYFIRNSDGSYVFEEYKVKVTR